MSSPDWKKYEAASRKIIQILCDEFGIASVQGETKLIGKCGTEWSVEGTATLINGEGFLVLECRRYKTKRLNQEALGGLAYRIQDTGAAGGIIVSPLPLQKGAQYIAEAENIIPIQIESWSTAEYYLAKILGKTFRGIGVKDSIFSAQVRVISIELNSIESDDKT